jgi:hypothetical protein
LNTYPEFGKEVFDNQWHKMEAYIHAGSGNNAEDAVCKLWIDDVLIFEDYAILSSAEAISSAPIEYMAGWPGSTSGTADGSAPFQLDDFEIFADIPSGGEPTTGSMEDGTIEVIGAEPPSEGSPLGGNSTLPLGGNSSFPLH